MSTRILSIDPGGTTAGFCITDYDEVNDACYIMDAFTVHLDKLVKQQYSNELNFYGEKITKLFALKDVTQKVLSTWQPYYIVSEGPYLGSFVTAFASLTSCVCAIRFAVREYSSYKDLTVIDPATVKKAIGVSGKSGDKELVRLAIAKRPLFYTDITLDKIDEHSVDAIAVGQWYIDTHIRRIHEHSKSSCPNWRSGNKTSKARSANHKSIK